VVVGIRHGLAWVVGVPVDAQLRTTAASAMEATAAAAAAARVGSGEQRNGERGFGC
jgi:hypothetical protein